jgi:hypothetical protein
LDPIPPTHLAKPSTHITIAPPALRHIGDRAVRISATI